MGLKNKTQNGNEITEQKSGVKCLRLISKVLAEKDSYVLDIALERNSNRDYAVSLSSQNIQIFSIEHETCIQSIPGHSMTISGIKYSGNDSSLLYSSSLDGTIRIWDLRAKGSKVQEFTDKTDGPAKGIASFDYNSDENYVCGGTEMIHEDAFLVFWDRRTSKILGGYWNSHTDDVTQVRFHPNKTNVMATGSLDGLINIFDLNARSEDDALLYTLNTESSVNKLAWKVSKDGDLEKDQVTCLTHIEQFQLWNINEASHNVMLTRDSLQNIHEVSCDYMIDAFVHKNSVYLSSGNHSGDIQLWHVNNSDGKLSLVSELCSAHSDDIRSISWNETENTLYTGGEDGYVCRWNF